jgi:DNA mismatch repair ATPase MutS
MVQLMDAGSSVIGARTLDRWLLEHAAPDDVRRRQEAAAELARNIEFREHLVVRGRRSRAVRMRDVDRFLAWAESPPWFLEHTALRVAAWLLPAATTVLLALHLTGRTGPLWIISASIAAAISLRMAPRIYHTFDAAFGREGMFAHFPELIGEVAKAEYGGALLQQLRARVRPDGESAEVHIARLRRLMHLADMRMSSIHFVVQVATLWDFHVAAALERWQRRHGKEVREWLHAAGEVEALCALGTLAHDHPEWAFPEFATEGEPRVDAEALGHPLIADSVRVHNDVRLGPPGTFLLITGSNMSGKSTLLRAVGVNVVLAGAGAPCCARRLVLTPLRVCTSIHVQDSLAQGMSHFMAELARLKQVVDAADDTRDGRPPVLFLLDEILHGTNTAERRIAARRVIRHLTNVGAIGAVTTHDLELVEDPVVAARAQLVHFQETFDESGDHSALSFDYTLREGLATSTNALKLMRYVGLPDE